MEATPRSVTPPKNQRGRRDAPSPPVFYFSLRASPSRRPPPRREERAAGRGKNLGHSPARKSSTSYTFNINNWDTPKDRPGRTREDRQTGPPRASDISFYLTIFIRPHWHFFELLSVTSFGGNLRRGQGDTPTAGYQTCHTSPPPLAIPSTVSMSDDQYVTDMNSLFMNMMGSMMGAGMSDMGFGGSPSMVRALRSCCCSHPPSLTLDHTVQ